MEYRAVSLKDKFSKFAEQWSPKIVAQVNDYHVKLARVQGEFIWHDHPETDELFFVVEGELTILLRDGQVTLKAGDLYVVPRGVEHKPVAAQECQILMFEPAGTVNTGDVQDEKTATHLDWI